MTGSIGDGGVAEDIAALLAALDEYFALMHDCDLARFDRVFAPSVQLHGFRDGAMVYWSAETYRAILAERRSPKSLGEPRVDEVLMIDLAAPTQAVTKVRVRISALTFVDHLIWHRIAGRWLVTAKGFHLEQVDTSYRPG